MQYYVYILANNNNTVLYTGVTNNLIRRVYEHKNAADPKSSSTKYQTYKLVYYEIASTAESAISREKQIKAGSRKKKDLLINKMNPQWKDLYSSILG